VVLPDFKRIELRVLGDTSTPEVREMKHVGAYRGAIEGNAWNVLWADWTHTPIEVYQFACDVIDRVQQFDESLATATGIVLHGMKTLLRQLSKLSREDEVGLFGYLIVLQLLGQLGSLDEAVKAWRGPDREEHDFVLAREDIEVKTTTSEKRVHQISSLSQLSAVGARPLSLVSIQITPKGGDDSQSLGDLVDRLVDSPGMNKPEFLDKLERAGYFTADADLYPTQWALRTPLQEYEVAGDFPRLAARDLERFGGGAARISDITYRINVEGLKPVPTRFGA
jgi:hypothetical protein